jgi:hypothetical protein
MSARQVAGPYADSVWGAFKDRENSTKVSILWKREDTSVCVDNCISKSDQFSRKTITVIPKRSIPENLPSLM